MLYGVLDQPAVDTAIYTCGNEVIHIGPVEPRLPCWRVSEVAPRAIERASHFDGRSVEEQWEILHGLLRRGQTREDIYVAFGEPYRMGIDAREDGTNASEHVYLDTTGDAYSMYLTFVDRSLRGWRFPPDRRLTMEAEQRRLDQMERRMIDQMRDMEAASIERHNAEVAHLTQIQSNQQQIRTDIAAARSAIVDTVESEAAETRGVVRAEGARTRRSVGRATIGGTIATVAASDGPRMRGPRRHRRRRRGRVETRTRARVSVSRENGRTVTRSRSVTVSRRR
jgi:hypothetical protein